MESYYQEAGRAGRDGENADCILLYNGRDVRINEFLITHSEDVESADPAAQAHNLELLKQMTFYAAGTDCLRGRILSYFGEEAPSYCGRCSNCLNEYEETDITLEAKKIISCVYRLRQRNRSFGKTMIIDILRGSKNEKIRNQSLDTLSTWGIMADTGIRRIRGILDFLVDEGYLVSTGDEYPVIALRAANDANSDAGFGVAGVNSKAEQILKNEKLLFMMLPKDAPKKQEEIIHADNNNGLFNNDLFTRLKDLRKELARKEGYPAFVIFSDASLRDMCRRQPVNLAQFSTVNGVGAVKLEKYGEAFTSLIRGYLEEN